jgi:hypothetical protein
MSIGWWRSPKRGRRTLKTKRMLSWYVFTAASRLLRVVLLYRRGLVVFGYFYSLRPLGLARLARCLNEKESHKHTNNYLRIALVGVRSQLEG